MHLNISRLSLKNDVSVIGTPKRNFPALLLLRILDAVPVITLTASQRKLLPESESFSYQFLIIMIVFFRLMYNTIQLNLLF
jgi:hypothetical protein